jgi:hypothetical protein
MAIPLLGGQGEMDASGGTAKEIKDDGPKIRVFYCWNCRSFDELPDFKGNPEDDTLLAILIEKHQSAGVYHSCTPLIVGVKTWANEKIRTEIIRQVRNQTNAGLDELDPTYYATRSMFYEDAMTCYGAHNRPKGDCADWKASNKRLLPKTSDERKDVGLPSPEQSAGTKVYLCDFCPVKSNLLNISGKK